MAISWTSAVALANRIASDVPAIKTMLDALAKMDFTAVTNLPENAKRMASVTGGMQLQKFVSGAWSTVGKLMHDVDSVDGKHAATGTNADTIPVRDANGALPGNITGNAATATSAQALSEVNPIAKGGTGASTASEARRNLGIVTATTSAQGLVRPDGQTISIDAAGAIFVPEYQGATASAPGTSGLVPPAAAGEQELFMTGGGGYKSALTKITDSVTSAASDTAASAKAVKSAYDRGSAGITAANSKAPDGFGLGAVLGKFVVDCKTEAWKFGLYVTNDTTLHRPPYSWCSLLAIPFDNGTHIYAFHPENKAVYRLTRDTKGVYSEWEEVVDYRGYVTNANLAQNATLARAAERLRSAQGDDMIFSWQGQGGQPDWVWGGNDGGTMYVWSPSSFNVNYANTANYANSAGSLSGMKITNQWTDRVTAPVGGTWYWVNVSGEWLVGIGGPVAGGSVVAMGSYSRSTLWIPSGA